MSNHYKHITLEGVQYIQAENSFRKMLAEYEWQTFDKANPPIIWYGEAFEGTISEEEIEFVYWLYNYWKPFPIKLLKDYEGAKIAARLKEQPVQQEDVYYCVKPSDIPCHKQCDSCKAVDSRFSVQPSTPIVEEQTVCSINCKCESGEDCDGESALNLIDLVEQQDMIAEIIEFVKSNLNTREEEVINIISDKYRITPIKK